jgi:hypothetical protein
MWLLLLVALAAAAPQAPASASDKRFTLSGQVIDGVSQRPLAGVEVTLQTNSWDPAGEPVAADAQGRFAFHNLAAGEYFLSAEGPFGTANYGELAGPGRGQIRLGPNQDNQPVVFRIMPRGVIEGTLRDESGDPLARATVRLMRPGWNNGRVAFQTLAQKPTDDRGRYRFGNLLPGGYIVCSGGGWGMPTAATPGPVDFAAGVPARAYPQSCHPASGPPCQLAPGGHVQIDLDLAAVAAATVRGRVLNLPQNMGASLSLSALDQFDGAGQFSNSAYSGQGTFAFRGIPPGRYLLSAFMNYQQPDGTYRAFSAALAVDVGGSDVDGLQLSMEAFGGIDVALEQLEENHIDRDTVGLAFRPRDAAMGRAQQVMQQQKNGALHYELAPGGYWIVPYAKGPVCLQSVKQGEEELHGFATVSAEKTQRLTAIFSHNCGEVRARTVQAGEPVPAAKIVLLRNGTPQDPGDLIQQYSDDQGESVFEGLPPGRYLLWAWKTDDSGILEGPANLVVVALRATVVEVKAGAPAKVDVPLLKTGGE